MSIKIFTGARRIEGVISYYGQLQELIKINEQFSFDGILFFENHSNDIDPWVFSQDLMTRSENQIPFIAINPFYQHPYTTALKLLSFASMYKRKVYLNFIAGTSISDLNSLGDSLSHDERYERLSEYIHILQNLITASRPFSFEGKYYQIQNLKLPGKLSAEFFPEYYIAGSSKAFAQFPNKNCKKNSMAKEVDKMAENAVDGLCFGIIARESREEANQVFIRNYSPTFSEYEDVLNYSMLNTDASWKNELFNEKTNDIFRMEAFKNFVSDSPYLVGSYEETKEYIKRYIAKGVTTFIIECDKEEAEHVAKVITGLKIT